MINWKLKFSARAIASALVPALASAALLSPFEASGETVERIVAIVNDEIVTLSDLNKFVERLKSGGLTDDLLIPDEAAKQELIKDREKLLRKMIDERILDSEVKKQNLSVPIERVEQEIRNIAKRNNVSRDDLKAALQDRGVAFSAYQDFIKTGLERQSLIEKAVTSRIKISEDDVISAFAASGGNAQEQAFEYTLSHIYFRNEKGGEPEAKKRAEATYKKLQEGVAFEKLASEASEDPAFEQGGLLGVFKTGELQKELESKIVKLTPGQFTAVLPTTGGFHIVRVTKKKLIADPRTEKDREKFRAQLYERAYKKQFESWLDQLRQDSFIRINK